MKIVAMKISIMIIIIIIIIIILYISTAWTEWTRINDAKKVRYRKCNNETFGQVKGLWINTVQNCQIKILTGNTYIRNLIKNVKKIPVNIFSKKCMVEM